MSSQLVDAIGQPLRVGQAVVDAKSRHPGCITQVAGMVALVDFGLPHWQTWCEPSDIIVIGSSVAEVDARVAAVDEQDLWNRTHLGERVAADLRRVVVGGTPDAPVFAKG